jgi:signal transduction histidine kinase
VEGALASSLQRLGLRDPGRQVDVALAAGAALLNVVGAVRPEPGIAYDVRTGWLPALLGAAAGAALLWRRSHALATFGFVVVAGTAATMLHWQSAIPVTILLAGYALGTYASPRAGVAGMSLAGALFAIMFVVGAPYFDSPLGLFAIGQVVVSWVVGLAVSHRRQLAALARDRRLALVRDGAREAEQAVLDERLRLARVLHAQVSTSLTAVTENAVVARTSGPADPQVLAEIESTARVVAQDLRRLLGTLREADGCARPDGQTLGRGDWPVDVTVGLGVVVLNVGGTLLDDPSSAQEYAEPVLAVLLLLSVLPGSALILRRRMPVIVLAVVAAVVATVFWLDWPEGNIPAALLIATYSVGAWTGLLRSAAAMFAMFATMGALSVVGPESMAFDWMFLLIFALPWIMGVAIRWRRTRDHADIDAMLAAEAEQAARVQRALQDERLAVARDLHDVVSHNLSGIVIQAAAARRRAADSDEHLLAVIEDAGREALAGLHAMVATLESRAVRQPAPGIFEIEALVRRYADRLGPVDLVVDRQVADASESIRVTAFRLVQEALTNVAKHATGGHASIAVLADRDAIRVVVENQAGRAGDVPGSGVGLAGMRERVELFGGELDAGVTASGGFEVRARLPRELPA